MVYLCWPKCCVKISQTTPNMDFTILHIIGSQVRVCLKSVSHKHSLHWNLRISLLRPKWDQQGHYNEAISSSSGKFNFSVLIYVSSQSQCYNLTRIGCMLWSHGHAKRGGFQVKPQWICLCYNSLKIHKNMLKFNRNLPQIPIPQHIFLVMLLSDSQLIRTLYIMIKVPFKS